MTNCTPLISNNASTTSPAIIGNMTAITPAIAIKGTIKVVNALLIPAIAPPVASTPVATAPASGAIALTVPPALTT